MGHRRRPSFWLLVISGLFSCLVLCILILNHVAFSGASVMAKLFFLLFLIVIILIVRKALQDAYVSVEVSGKRITLKPMLGGTVTLGRIDGMALTGRGLLIAHEGGRIRISHIYFFEDWKGLLEELELTSGKQVSGLER